MKRTAKFLAAGCALLGILSCHKEEIPEFGILGGNEYAVENAGGYVTVIMHTNLAYVATPSADWCHIVVKQPICFKVQVDENATLMQREAYISVETDGFDPVFVKITQAAGQLFFRMEESEKSKTFSAGGETQTVALQTNMGDYDVISSEDWCHVGTKTKDGFEVICDARDDYGSRSAILTLEMDGLEGLEGVSYPVEISVIQKGNNMILNPVFADDNMDGWVSEPENIFALNDSPWVPGDIENGHDIEINSGNNTGQPKPVAPYSGYFLYHLENVTAGEYTFSFRSQRGSSSVLTMYYVLRDSEGNDLIKEVIPNLSGWGTNICKMTVARDGAYDVGVYIDVAEGGSPWFNLIDFKFE